jgi:hypothetical protein
MYLQAIRSAKICSAQLNVAKAVSARICILFSNSFFHGDF